MSEDIIDLLLETLESVGIKKEKWKNKYDKFIVQNFSKESLRILGHIIDKKE